MLLVVVAVRIIFVVLHKRHKMIVWALFLITILIFLALVYFMSFGAYGGKAIFLDIVRRFSKLEEEEKHAVAKRGGRYFYLSLLSFLIVSGVVVYLIKYVY